MKKILSIILTISFVLSLTITEPATAFAAQSGDFTYSISNSAATITGYTGAGGEVVIPDMLGGYPVKTIGQYAFKDSTAITGITVPNSVTRIGYAAFEGCTGLLKVKIGNHVKTINELAFGDCTGIKNIIIPANVTKINGNAFYGCFGLEKVFFLGNSPDMYSEFQADHPDDLQGTDVVWIFAFNNCSPDIRFYYINGKTGFKKSLKGYKSSTFPTINPVTDESTIISGISLPSKDIKILVGSKTYYTKTNNAGKWSKVLTKKLSAGIKITVKVTINSSKVASKSIIVTS